MAIAEQTHGQADREHYAWNINALLTRKDVFKMMYLRVHAHFMFLWYQPPWPGSGIPQRRVPSRKALD
jgi:hypothetical protein